MQDKIEFNRYLLESDRLILRPVSLSDADYYFRTWNDLEFRKYLWDDKPVSLDTVKFHLEASMESFNRDGFGVWAIALKNTQELIDFSGLRYVENSSEIELLYGIERKYWSQGLGTESSIPVLVYGFQKLELNKILGRVNPNNPASGRVLSKIGMQFVQAIATDIEPLYCYEISREAFLNPTRIN